MLSKIFKSVSPFTTVRGRILEDFKEICDIIREHILPAIPQTSVGAELFFILCNDGTDGSTRAIDAVDTIQFYRKGQTQIPLTYATICTLVAQQREQMSPADTRDLCQLGCARDIYEIIQAQEDLMLDIDEGLERGVRNEFVIDAATAARMTKRFWEEQQIMQRIDDTLSTGHLIPIGQGISESILRLALYAGRRMSREEYLRLSLAYTLRETPEPASLDIDV